MDKSQKLSKNNKLELDKVVRTILKNPSIGTEKKGDLVKMFVYKYKVRTQQYLLAYRFFDTDLELMKIADHQNFGTVNSISDGYFFQIFDLTPSG